MRGAAMLLGGGVWLAARVVIAQEPAEAAAPIAAPALPVDGAVAFSYARDAGVTGCSQPDESAMRDLLRSVMRVDPFVPAGAPAPFSVSVRVTRTRSQRVRATFELLDAGGASLGASAVEDATCDGTHLKLASSIALLLQPVPPSGTAARAPESHAGDRQSDAPTGAPANAAVPPDAASGAPSSVPPVSGNGLASGPAQAPDTRPPIIARERRQHVCKVPLIGYCVGVDIYSLAFSAGGIMSLGFTADPAPGAWLGAELRPIENISVALELRGVFPSRVVADLPADPSKPSDSPKEPLVSNVVVQLVPCFRYWWLMGCAVAQLGFSAAQTPVALTGWPSYGVGPRIGLEIPFAERFFVRAQGDVIFDFGAHALTLPDVNLKWQQSTVAGFVGLGLGVTFR